MDHRRSFDETFVQMPSVGWLLFSSKPCDSDRSCDHIDHVAMAHRRTHSHHSFGSYFVCNVTSMLCLIPVWPFSEL